MRIANHRWIIERDYQELNQELGLGQFEGRGWRYFHQKATLCLAAYGFTVAERNYFSPRHGSAILDYRSRRHDPPSALAGRVRPERYRRLSISTLRVTIARCLLPKLPCCQFC